MRLKVLLLLLVSVVLMYAADTSSVKILGVSKTGDKLAYELSGIRDGSGFAYSEINVLDLNTNSTQQIKLEGDDDTAPLKKIKNQTFAKFQKSKLGKLISSKNMLKQINSSKVSTADNTDIKEFTIDKSHYTLKQRETKIKSECAVTENSSLVNLGLYCNEKLISEYKELKEVQFKKCSFNYTIENIYSYKTYIYIMLKYNKQGFEGADERQYIVGFKIK